MSTLCHYSYNLINVGLKRRKTHRQLVAVGATQCQIWQGVV